METKPHLPMPLTGARRIENERLAYRETQRLHHAAFPDYSRGGGARATRPLLACWT
jgi:hypothetical protein